MFRTGGMISRSFGQIFREELKREEKEGEKENERRGVEEKYMLDKKENEKQKLINCFVVCLKEVSRWEIIHF